MNRLAIHARDLWEQVLAPGVPALLPQRAGQALRRVLARRSGLYADVVAGSAHVAQPHGVVADADHWARTQRMARLLDMGDALVLARWRPRAARWMRRWLAVEGQWPAPGQPFMGISFHFGTGLWALAHLREHGTPAAFLARRYDRAMFGGRSVAWWAARQREAGVRGAGGAPVIFTGGSRARIAASLAAGTAVIGLIDTPVEGNAPSIEVSVRGLRLTLPRGLIDAAHAAGVPVVLFSVTPDLDSGARALRIEPALAADDTALIAARIGAHLERLLADAPACWYFWSELAALQRRDEPDPSAPT